MTWRLRFHPLVERDLDGIAQWIIDHAGDEAADRTLTEIERIIADLARLPHRGSIRDDIAPGLRAIPAARRGVIAFTVHDEAAEVLIHAVTYGGADWVRQVRLRAPRDGEPWLDQ